MYSKFLFVGLGGSGGKTLRFLKREIQAWMTGHQTGPDIPQGWQFLHIDTPNVPDGDEINHLADHLSPDEYLGLIREGMTFQALQNVLDAQKPLWSELLTWRVEPSGLGVGIALGAGQKRAVGQSISVAYAHQIRERIQMSVSRLQSSRADAEIGELYSKVTNKTPDTHTHTYVVIISSLAGGTGAGLLTITCDILRAMDTPAGDNLFSILYTPEVFRSLRGAAGGGIQANSLAAISELLNGHWWNGSTSSSPGMVPPIESTVLRQAGLPEPMERSGPTYPFLVGLVGAEGIDHGTPDQLFELAGRSLLSWVCDEIIQAKFIAYTAGNWANAANSMPQSAILVDEGEPNETGPPCFSALGFSRLSVGTTYLEKYAVQRLTRDAFEHLLNYHHSSAEAIAIKNQKDTSSPQVLLESMANTHLPSFLRDAHLTELGSEESEIVDALRPPDIESLHIQFLNRALELSEINTPQTLEVEQWRELIHDGIDAALSEFENEYQTKLEISTREWINNIQVRICKAVAKWMASHGWLIVTQFCHMTAAYLKGTVVRDLTENNLNQCHVYVQWRHRYVDEQLEGIRGRIGNDNLQLREAVEAGVNGANYAGEAQLIERASVLAREMTTRVLLPFETALRKAYEQAKSEAHKVSTWIEWDNPSPSASVKPPTGDFSLIDPDDYPKLFEDLLKKDTGTGTAEIQAPRTLARQDIISGQFLEEVASGGTTTRPKLDCVQVINDWWPSGGAAIAGVHTAARLEVDIAASLQDLTNRAREWLHRHGSAWNNYLSLGIRTFVSTTDDTVYSLQDRQTVLKTQLSAALAAAAPLITIDSTTIGLVHPNAPEKPKVHISQIPMSGHNMESQIRALLHSHGLGDNELEGTFSNDGRVRHIDITSALAAPHSILTIESLLRPIEEQWAKVSGTQDAKNFWLHRRAQPLRRFIPAPQATILSMIRGWFTGRLLGRIKVDQSRISISSPSEGVVHFPKRFLSAPRSKQDTLALLLESLPLAYVEVSRAERLSPLQPYIELRELGRSWPGSGLYSYESLSPALSEWVDTGEFLHSIARPFLQKEEFPEPDPRIARLTYLVELLRDQVDGYQDLYHKYTQRFRESRTMISNAPLWIGLWDPLMMQALKNLVRVADKHRDTLSADEGLM